MAYRTPIDLETVGKVRPISDAKTLIFGLTDLLFSPNRTLLFLVDFFVVALGFIVSTWMSPFGVWGALEKPIVIGSLSFAVSYTAIALGLGYYERARRYSLYKVVTSGLVACLLSLAIGSSVVYFTYYGVFGRLTFGWGAVGAYICVTTFRIGLAQIYRYLPYRFTIVGSSAGLEELKAFISSASNKEARYFVYTDIHEFERQDGSVSLDAMHSAKIGDVVFARSALADTSLLDLAIDAVKCNFKVLDEIEFYASIFERLPLDGISNSWLLHRGLNTRAVGAQFIKRSVDVIVSALGLIVLSPVLTAIAVAVKLSSRGNVLFVQPRQGRFNSPFKMFKFRTMREDASCKAASGGFTKANDMRVTWIGRIIRPLHLDELPQLLNILKGDMSLVGPRPEALTFARRMAQEIDLYEIRYLVRPGLTGHAQILNGYMMDTVEDTKKKLEFDLYYICNYTIFLDLRVLIRTAFVVIRRLFA